MAFAAEYASMKKSCDTMYAAMDKVMAGLGPQLKGVDRYAAGIRVIRERIREVTAALYFRGCGWGRECSVEDCK
jgi:hypothetical protein